MSTTEPAIDNDEVEQSLQAYKTHMNIGNFEEAVGVAERLTSKDCAVCESFGNHLMGLAVAVAECPTNSVRVTLVECAVESADTIKDDIVGA